MSVDAVALFRPRSLAALRPYIDLDDESEEPDGFYAEALDDGSVLVHTFQPFTAFEVSPIEGRAWLSEFGEDLPLVHHDARGCLFFPDVCAPRGCTYDAVVAEIESAGVWVPTVPLTAEEAQALEASMAAEADEMDRVDMAAWAQGTPEDDHEGPPPSVQESLDPVNPGTAGMLADMANMIAALQKQRMGEEGQELQDDAAPGDDVVLQPWSLDRHRAERKAKLRKLFGEG